MSGLSLPLPHNLTLDFLRPLRYRSPHAGAESGSAHPARQSQPPARGAGQRLPPRVVTAQCELSSTPCRPPLWSQRYLEAVSPSPRDGATGVGDAVDPKHGPPRRFRGCPGVPPAAPAPIGALSERVGGSLQAGGHLGYGLWTAVPLISENNTATAPRKLAEDEPGARGHRNFHARARYDHKQPRLYSQSVPDLGADTLINTVGSLSIGIEMEAEPDTNPPVVNLTPFAVLTVKASGMV